ncbi:MaoC family dehydratase N-terminal domain-containing protein [Rhodococcus aerolatus]
MSLNQSFVGRRYPFEHQYEVGREKIREFATAVGATDAAHHDEAAARALGHADLVAPPTFAIVATLPATNRVVADPDLGLDYTRVVHFDQRFVHHRPILAGDRLSMELVIDSIRSAAGNDVITARTELTDPAGAGVCTAYSTLVVRGATEPDAGAATTGGAA